MLYRSLRLLLLIILKLFFRLEIVGREYVPKKGALIVASNHVSNLDPIAVGVASPRKLHFLAKEELYKMPLFSWLIPRLSCLPVKRNKADIFTLKQSLKILQEQKAIGLFPQGTRTTDAHKVYSGVGFLVNKSKVPVICARIYNTDKILPKGAIFPKFRKIRVVFDKPQTFNKYRQRDEIAREIIKRINAL